MLDTVNQAFVELIKSPFSLGVRYSAFYIAGTIVIVWLIWLYRREDQSFIAFLVPKAVYTHRSNLLDIKLMITNRLLSSTGVLGTLVFGPFVVFMTASLLSGNPQPDIGMVEVTWGTAFLVSFVMLVSQDFCKYWHHRLMHEWQVLWPFHSVHHSAEVLTPITVIRSHPVDLIVRTLFYSLILGVVQGILVFLFVGEVGLLTIGGANAFVFFVNLLGANLRHSHVWLSFGRTIEHVMISPAQHQVHHSCAKEHHNKNYGSLFALWDWWFGTLYIPEKREDLTFGLADAEGNPLPQPHNTLGQALFGPFSESFRNLRGSLPSRETSAQSSGAVAPQSPPISSVAKSDF